MVEAGLGLLLFLILVVALFEFGRAVWSYTTLAHASRQGARYAVTRGSRNPTTADQVQNVVKQHVIGLDPTKLAINVSWNPGNTRGSIIQVQVRYPFQFAAADLVVAGATGVQLGSTSRMVIAN